MQVHQLRCHQTFNQYFGVLEVYLELSNRFKHQDPIHILHQETIIWLCNLCNICEQLETEIHMSDMNDLSTSFLYRTKYEIRWHDA